MLHCILYFVLSAAFVRSPRQTLCVFREDMSGKGLGVLRPFFSVCARMGDGLCSLLDWNYQRVVFLLVRVESYRN